MFLSSSQILYQSLDWFQFFQETENYPESVEDMLAETQDYPNLIEDQGQAPKICYYLPQGLSKLNCFTSIANWKTVPSYKVLWLFEMNKKYSAFVGFAHKI